MLESIAIKMLHLQHVQLELDMLQETTRGTHAMVGSSATLEGDTCQLSLTLFHCHVLLDSLDLFAESRIP